MNTDERLSAWQRNKLCEVILLGCDRMTACNYVGATPGQLQEEIDRDEAFGREVTRSEAQAEMRHMGNVHKAALNEKNWRTSVWWLERRAEERAQNAPLAASEAHVAELVDRLAQVIVTIIVDATTQRQLIERLYEALEDGREGAVGEESEPTKLITSDASPSGGGQSEGVAHVPLLPHPDPLPEGKEVIDAANNAEERAA